MQKIRHYFPGGNTSRGFVSFYDEILKKDSTGKLAVIKGGPGTGKSSFMKKIGRKLEGNGELIDYLHCSSDSNSLDGVFLPKYNTAIIDGTAPHIVDARYPASSDIVLNFCDFINETEIKKNNEEIKDLCFSISDKFNESYDYLAASAKISELMEKRIHIDEREVINIAYELSKRVMDSPKYGSFKKFFLSAITPTGTKNYMDYDFLDRYVIKLDCQLGDCGYRILEKVIGFCENGNIDMEVYYCPMKPDKPEHIIFPMAHTAITIGNQYHNYSHADEIIYFSDFKKHDYDNSHEQAIYEDFVKRAVSCISEAKSLHDELEKYYIENVDFDKVKMLEERAITFLTEN